MFSSHGYPTRVLLIGLTVRLLLAPFFVQSYDFVHLYYSAFDIVKGINPYVVYDFAYPPVMLYVLSFLTIIYFRAGLFLENLGWPSAIDWPPSLFKAAFISTPLIGFDVPPPLFNLVFKIPILVADTAVAILLYKICYMQMMDIGLAKKSMLLWYLNPLTIWMSSIHGAFDSVAVFFALFAFYLLIRNRYCLGAFSLGIGTLTKLYPAFIIPVAFSWSLRAKRAYLFAAGLATSLIICLAPLFMTDSKSFYYVLFGTRSSTLFVGGLNPWGVKYLYQPIELWTSANPQAIFLTMSFLLGFSILLICMRAWRKPPKQNIVEMNHFVLASLAAVYIFSPVIIQAQYALWALPFLIINCMPFYSNHSSSYALKIQTFASRFKFTIQHKFSYVFYLHLFWMSALAFEISLQAFSVALPIVLRTGFSMDFFSAVMEYWVVHSVYIRALIFFLSAMFFTISYLIALTAPRQYPYSAN